MTDKEIESAEKDIATFMGGQCEYDASIGWIKNVSGLPDANDRFEIAKGKYHSSWDWLMPTWAKFRNEIYMSEWYEDISDEYVEKQIAYMTASLEMVIIEAAFKHFVNIIHWYNQQSK